MYLQRNFRRRLLRSVPRAGLRAIHNRPGREYGSIHLTNDATYPNTKVKRYEPLPSNFLQLKRTIELSGLNDVQIFMQGVGSTPRTEKTISSFKDHWGHSIFQSQAARSEYIEVDLIDVEGLLRSTNGRNL
jgi:hypothetical protein